MLLGIGTLHLPSTRGAGRSRPARIGLPLDNVGGLKPFGPLDHFEFHRRAFLKVAVALSLDSGIVDEDVFTLSPLDEPVALGGVEPFHSALFSIIIRVHMCSLSLVLFALRNAFRLKKLKNTKGREAFPAAFEYGSEDIARATNAPGIIP